MKKILIVVAIIMTILCMHTNNKIPKESIRFRVIAQDNDEESQKLKKKIVSNLTEEINKIEKVSLNIKDSRKIIKQEIPTINKIISKTISESGINKSYHIKYGYNHFPEKKYHGIIYDEGKYESLVITIEEGKGDNFWCVLFPPLCLVDQTKSEDIEYTSILQEIVKKYF